MKLSYIFESRRHCAAEGMRCLTKQDLESLAKHLPSISTKEIDDILYDEMYLSGRMPGGDMEEWEYLGLCGQISSKIRDLLKSKGAEYKSGRFEITPNKGDIHCWVELDNKIIDFTASQFNPWLSEDLPDLLIIDKSDPFTKHYVDYTSKRADDFEYITSGASASDKIMQKYLDRIANY